LVYYRSDSGLKRSTSLNQNENDNSTPHPQGVLRATSFMDSLAPTTSTIFANDDQIQSTESVANEFNVDLTTFLIQKASNNSTLANYFFWYKNN